MVWRLDHKTLSRRRVLAARPTLARCGYDGLPAHALQFTSVKDSPLRHSSAGRCTCDAPSAMHSFSRRWFVRAARTPAFEARVAAGAERFLLSRQAGVGFPPLVGGEAGGLISGVNRARILLDSLILVSFSSFSIVRKSRADSLFNSFLIGSWHSLAPPQSYPYTVKLYFPRWHWLLAEITH
jgi:hypothetical protein